MILLSGIKKQLFFAALFGSLIVSCSKASSKKWLVADLTVQDGSTGAPVMASVKLTYLQESLLSQDSEVELALGNTDGSGHLKIEQPISRNGKDFMLEIYHGGYVEPIAQGLIPSKTVPVYAKGENEITVLLDPWYSFLMYAKNENCTGQSDTLWVTIGGHTDTLVGCADTFVPGRYHGLSGSFGITDSQKGPVLTVDIKTRKSGIVNTYQENFTLQPAQITILELVY